MSGSPNDQDRRLRDLMGLVKFCLETTAREDASGPSVAEPMDEERREWLQQALDSMTIDIAQEMVKCLTTIKQGIEEMKKLKNQNGNESHMNGNSESRWRGIEIDEGQMLHAMECLIDLCEDADYSKTFANLKGFDIFHVLLLCDHVELQGKACDLLAALSQNNVYSQTLATDLGLLERLIQMVDDDDEDCGLSVQVRVKALYALSTIIRCNEKTLKKFYEDYKGLNILAQLLSAKETMTQDSQSSSTDFEELERWRRRLRIKASFLLAALCSESEHVIDTLFKMGIVNKIMTLLKSLPHEETHEYLLAALLSLAKRCPEYKQECLKSEFGLREILHEKLSTQCIPESDYESERDMIKELKNVLDS